MLEITHNHPIDFEILKNIYKDNNDLQKAWPGAKYPLCVEEWQDFLNTSPRYASLVFKKLGSIIGHLVLFTRNDNQIYLCFILLDKDHRGQGYIYELLRFTEQFALKHFDSQVLWLHVDPQNLPALKAYEKFGFKFVEMTEQGRLRMKKVLENQ